MIETSGVIEKEQGNGFYLVTLEQPEGHQCRGRITYRERNAGGAKPTTNKNNPKRNNK